MLEPVHSVVRREWRGAEAMLSSRSTRCVGKQPSWVRRNRTAKRAFRRRVSSAEGADIEMTVLENIGQTNQALPANTVITVPRWSTKTGLQQNAMTHEHHDPRLLHPLDPFSNDVGQSLFYGSDDADGEVEAPNLISTP